MLVPVTQTYLKQKRLRLFAVTTKITMSIIYQFPQAIYGLSSSTKDTSHRHTAHCLCLVRVSRHEKIQGTYGVKFRSGNVLENGNENRWNLPYGELLLSLICTRSFGKNSPVHIKDNNNSPRAKFRRFLFPFSSKFPDLRPICSVLKPVRDTNSQPGSPVWELRQQLLSLLCLWQT